MMAMGSYHWAALRLIFGTEPEECLSCDNHLYTEGVHKNCGYDLKAKFRLRNSGIGDAASTLRGPTLWTPSHTTVTTRLYAISSILRLVDPKSTLCAIRVWYQPSFLITLLFPPFLLDRLQSRRLLITWHS